MALTLTASTVVASVKPTVSSNRRYVDVVCARIFETMRFALFFFGREWEDVGNTRAFFNGIPLCAALETNGWSGSSLSLSLSICAASNENDAFVVTYAQSSFACTTSVVRARVRKLCHFLDNPQNDPMISLSFYRKLTLFLPSFTPAKQQILQGRVVLQDRRFCPDCLVRFQRVFFILFYPFVRSFVVRNTTGSKSFKQSSRKKKRIKIILSALSPFFFERLSKSNAFSQHESNQNQSLTNSFFAFVFSRLRFFTQTAKETSSNKNPANPSPPPRCRRWKSPKSPTPPRKSGTSPPLCSVAPSSVWRSVSCY